MVTWKVGTDNPQNLLSALYELLFTSLHRLPGIWP